VDPLLVINQAESQGRIPKPIALKVRVRMRYLLGAVDRVERASGLAYPPYYVEPTLPVTSAGAEYGQTGVLFARVIPATAAGRLSIIVQFTAALVAFSPKGTLEAVAAHEFTHYVDLVRRLRSSNVLSDERATTMFEASYADTERTVPPSLVFADRALVALVRKKFRNGLSDSSLSRKVEQNWVAKNLPVRNVAIDDNVVKLGMDAVAAARYDPSLLQKISQIEAKMTK